MAADEHSGPHRFWGCFLHPLKVVTIDLQLPLNRGCETVREAANQKGL
jgi:hypothetical protein